MAEELRDHSKRLDAEVKDRRDRLKRTEGKIRGLIGFIATGDRSDYIASTLRDLEAFARTQKAEIAARKSPGGYPSDSALFSRTSGGSEDAHSHVILLRSQPIVGAPKQPPNPS